MSNHKTIKPKVACPGCGVASVHQSDKITGPRSWNFAAPKQQQPAKEVAVSKRHSSCAPAYLPRRFSRSGRIDLTGKRVGRLTVLFEGHVKQTASGAKQYFWLCKCDCGKEVFVDGCCLRRGTTTSCGCYSRDRSTKHGLAKRNRKTGETEHWIYKLWHGMKARCYNPNHKNYVDYGGRGITVCERWLNSVEAFYADMGDRPSDKHSIDRIDNDGPYSPDNCRWATMAEQNEGTRQTHLITASGITLSIGKWAKRLGVSRRTIASRIGKLGWSPERAVTTPVRNKKAGAT